MACKQRRTKFGWTCCSLKQSTAQWKCIDHDIAFPARICFSAAEVYDWENRERLTRTMWLKQDYIIYSIKKRANAPLAWMPRPFCKEFTCLSILQKTLDIHNLVGYLRISTPLARKLCISFKSQFACVTAHKERIFSSGILFSNPSVRIVIEQMKRKM